ncbi:hypothetical protein LWI29_028558 [Acer saccharum]|uniref:Uncharacterized protein n=1 Tax=Acer saccharum TaxID=4024 RepID=A0AA39S589_ACESA|nr:hypothetical protein LWI29_028558 [Acer saccharum]
MDGFLWDSSNLKSLMQGENEKRLNQQNKDKIRQFPYPIFWMPSDNSKQGEAEKADQREVNAAPISIEEPTYSFKFIPVKPPQSDDGNRKSKTRRKMAMGLQGLLVLLTPKDSHKKHQKTYPSFLLHQEASSFQLHDNELKSVAATTEVENVEPEVDDVTGADNYNRETNLLIEQPVGVIEDDSLSASGKREHVEMVKVEVPSSEEAKFNVATNTTSPTDETSSLEEVATN